MRLTRPKGIKDFTALRAKKVASAATEEIRKEEYLSAEGRSEAIHRVKSSQLYFWKLKVGGASLGGRVEKRDC